jgi:cell division protein FtsW (lipid II flippase)
MKNTRNIWQNFDFWLFGAALILSILGIALIRSSIAGNIELVDHPQRQTTFLASAWWFCLLWLLLIISIGSH